MHKAWAIGVLCARICIAACEAPLQRSIKLAVMQKSLLEIGYTIKVDLSPPRDTTKISSALSPPPETMLQAGNCLLHLLPWRTSQKSGDLFFLGHRFLGA